MSVAGPLLIAAIGWLSPVAGDAALTVNVEFVCRANCPPSLRIIAMSEDQGVPEAEWQLPSGTSSTIHLRGATVWRLRAEASRVWLRDLTLTSDDDGRMIQWTVWPAVSLRGAFDRAPSTKPALTIRPLQNEPQADFVEATVECDVAKAEFRCDVPSIPFDARIRTDGFVPHYFFDVDPRVTTSLGVIALRKGASVSGFVQLPRPAVPTAATISLEAETAASGADRLRLGLRSLTAKPNERGFFQFSGVPAGRYTLSARAAGYSAATRPALELEADGELFLEQPLIILPLAAIDIGIEPPVSSDGTPWAVKLARYRPVSEYLEPVAEGEASMSGWWSREGLDQGSYHATVWSPGGEPVASQSIDVRSEKETVHIRLDQVPIEGKVFRSRTPLAGFLTFRHPSGQRRTMKADRDGAFEGVLPNEGLWDVTMSPEGLRSAVRLDPVSVHRRSDGAAIKLQLEIPAGELTGVVKDTRGNGTLATVFLTSAGEIEAVIETEANGEFVAWGLHTGTLAARAVTASAESQDVAVEIDDEAPAEVTFILEPFHTVRGIVVDPAGNAVAGAAVKAWAAGRPTRRTLTGPSGRFELKVIDASSTILAVLTPSFPISFFPVDATTLLELRLPPSGSILRIHMKKAPPWPFLLVGGTPVAVPDLFVPSSFPGGSPRGIGESGAELMFATRRFLVCPEQVVSPKCVEVDFAIGESVKVDASEWWSDE